MDAVKKLRGRSGTVVPGNGSKSPDLRQCGYCKAKFQVDPKFPHKKFCSDTHRKLAHRYGALSIGKIAERTMRDARKLIEAEVAPLREELRDLHRRLDLIGVPQSVMAAGSERTA